MKLNEKGFVIIKVQDPLPPAFKIVKLFLLVIKFLTSSLSVIMITIMVLFG